MMGNNGKEYEQFVQCLIQAIINSETTVGQKNIIVRHNEIINDINGNPRQFDIVWDYELGGVTYRTIIECKDYNSTISIDKIDSLVGKLTGFPGVRGIIATTKGFQSGAKEQAKRHNIELLCVREQNDNDWIDSDGVPLIREVILNIMIFTPPCIIKYEVGLDKKYIEEKDIDVTSIDFSTSLNTNIIIEDMKRNEKYSLFELQNKIADEKDNYGEHEKDITFDNAYISNEIVSVKLKKLHIKYLTFPPTTETIKIDFSKELVGVVEYLLQGKKKIILRNGQIRTEEIPNLQNLMKES